MKVTFENGVATYSGKWDEIVYQSWYNNRLCLARKYYYPDLGAIHVRMQEVGLNLSRIYKHVEAAYVADLKAYAKKNAMEHFHKAKRFRHPMPSAKAIFVKCMWAWQQSDPEHVELSSVTLEDILQLDAPVLTVKRCVDAEFLKSVVGYELLTHPMTSSH